MKLFRKKKAMEKGIDCGKRLLQDMENWKKVSSKSEYQFSLMGHFPKPLLIRASSYGMTFSYPRAIGIKIERCMYALEKIMKLCYTEHLHAME